MQVKTLYMLLLFPNIVVHNYINYNLPLNYFRFQVTFPFWSKASIMTY